MFVIRVWFAKESFPMAIFAANPEDITLPEDFAFEDQPHDGIYRLNSI